MESERPRPWRSNMCQHHINITIPPYFLQFPKTEFPKTETLPRKLCSSLLLISKTYSTFTLKTGFFQSLEGCSVEILPSRTSTAKRGEAISLATWGWVGWRDCYFPAQINHPSKFIRLVRWINPFVCSLNFNNCLQNSDVHTIWGDISDGRI